MHASSNYTTLLLTEFSDSNVKALSIGADVFALFC